MSNLPDWLDPLPDAQSMRATDAWTIAEVGVASLELMERAGEGLARIATEVAPVGAIVVACGKGNNGGDGLVVARLLREAGREVDVVFASEPVGLSVDAAANLERLPGQAATTLAGPLRADAGLVIDALLGTGATGEPRGDVARAIEAIGACNAPVLAADVPSGVDASTGAVAGVAVCATATATFHAAKPGLWIEPGRSRAGTVHVIDIGIPPQAPGEATVGLIHDEPLLGLLPRRERGSTKFMSGAVLVVGGSPGLTGAPCMAALAAGRAGAGYVTAAVPASLSQIFETSLMEVMTLGLPDDAGALTVDAVERLPSATTHGGAIVLGPGIGRSDGALAFVRRVIGWSELSLVLDADGLSAYTGNVSALASRGQVPLVLTPHEGELGRLLGIPSAEVAAQRLHHVREAASTAAAIVVLKGDDTLIADPEGRVAVSPGATPGLATAGTGDVLSGVLGALLAAGVEPFTAAAAGVRLHALAAIAAAARRGRDGMIASDVIEELSLVRTR